MVPYKQQENRNAILQTDECRKNATISIFRKIVKKEKHTNKKYEEKLMKNNYRRRDRTYKAKTGLQNIYWETDCVVKDYENQYKYETNITMEAMEAN